MNSFSITQTLKQFMNLKYRWILWGRELLKYLCSQEISYSVSQRRRPLLGDLTRCQRRLSQPLWCRFQWATWLSLSSAVQEHSALESEWRRGSRLPCTHTSQLSNNWTLCWHSLYNLHTMSFIITLLTLLHYWTLNKPWHVVFS